MSFTTADVGFSGRRYAFDDYEFGLSEFGDTPDALDFEGATPCATCGTREENALCVACADLDFIDAVSVIGGLDQFLNSVDHPADEPELEEDEEDEEEDDDTDSEKAWVSSPGIRL